MKAKPELRPPISNKLETPEERPPKPDLAEEPESCSAYPFAIPRPCGFPGTAGTAPPLPLHGREHRGTGHEAPAKRVRFSRLWHAGGSRPRPRGHGAGPAAPRSPRHPPGPGPPRGPAVPCSAGRGPPRGSLRPPPRLLTERSESDPGEPGAEECAGEQLPSLEWGEAP
ncbi:proline-rich protein 2-like [Passer montanus]|uniref:proline-rich protein 2-like n=1 Tax=Passer montanus TaxID=9160 RepID=UPI0019613A8E|nr:proline-rich protein 2-like [Passer montanus]